LLVPFSLVAALQQPQRSSAPELRATVTVTGQCEWNCAAGSMTLGSGVIVGRRPDGSLVVVTARHVIEHVSTPQIYVRDGAEPGVDFASFARERDARRATVIAYADNVDLALVAFRPRDQDDYGFAALAGEDGLAGTRPGVVVGDPYGSLWIASRFTVVSDNPTTFLLDCETCGPGDSGGGVFDATGRLLGILVDQRIDGDDAGAQHRTSQFLAVSPAELRLFLAKTDRGPAPNNPGGSQAWVRFEAMRAAR
jgi:hypothetical protein